MEEILEIVHYNTSIIGEEPEFQRLDQDHQQVTQNLSNFFNFFLPPFWGRDGRNSIVSYVEEESDTQRR
jgi:hypothetical protein